MRITRDFIQKYTHEFIERRVFTRHDLIAVCMCGSFLRENYLLGGAGDVDLFMIHLDTPSLNREIVRITEDIHLDIAHFSQQDFRDTRRLRIDPWIGPSLNTCKILYDNQHFMDFVQASIRGQFDRTDYIYQRVRPLAAQARETWFHLQSEQPESEAAAIQNYLQAVGMAANAIASLSGPPLTPRRMLLEFLQRAESQNHPGFYHGLLGLLGAPKFDPLQLEGWLSAWEAAFRALPEFKKPTRLHPDRLKYYLESFKAISNSERPFTLLWPLLTTWTALIVALPADSPHIHAWQQAAASLELLGPALNERILALDAYLDMVEETIESWAQNNGVWEADQ